MSQVRNNKKAPRLLRMALIAILVAAGISLIGNGLWIKVKSEIAQILLNQAFERVQTENNPANIQSSIRPANFARPWSWADIEPIARLSAERLGKTNIILNATSGEALAFGPGHLPGTPLPGARGTSVLAAHRDTHFAWIKDLKTGDKLTVENADGTISNFSVRRQWVARFDQSGINADSDDHLLALSTCYPFDAKSRGPLRYIVEAELIQPPKHTALLDSRQNR